MGSTGAKVVKRLPIKILPPKAFEGDRDYKPVATWLREVENVFRAMAVEEHQKPQMATGLLGWDVLTWWVEYIKARRSWKLRCLGWNSRLLSQVGLPQSKQTFVR